MGPMTYKGYAAHIGYSDEDELLVGRIVGIRDIVTFHGESVNEIRDAFHEAVDFYLDTCAARGEQPNPGKAAQRFPNQQKCGVLIWARIPVPPLMLRAPPPVGAKPDQRQRCGTWLPDRHSSNRSALSLAIRTSRPFTARQKIALA